MCPSGVLIPSMDDHAEASTMYNHLQNIMLGGPNPENVLTDFNPCAYPPWDLPEGMLYFNTRDAKSQGNRVTDVGYWKENDSTLTGGRLPMEITALEFYTGQAPHGDRTGWMMQNSIAVLVENFQGSSSLSRVFNRSDQNHSEEHLQAGSDDDSDSDLERARLMSLENENNNRNLQESSNKSQVLSRNERGLSTVSGNDVQNRDNFPQNLNEAYDFSSGDFIEENDLNAASFSSSENSSITSMSSDGIDPEDVLHPDLGLSLHDLLHDLETPAIPATNQRNSDCHHNVSIPQGSHHVLIQPAPLGSIGSSRNSSPRTNVTAVSASMSSDHARARALPAAPVVRGRPVRRALNHRSAAGEVQEVDQGPSTSRSAKVHGKRKAVSWRIAKIGKKYCCFFQF